jgi:hypothetical protein
MAVDGDVRVDNGEAEPMRLVSQGRVTGEPWISLSAGSRVVVRDPRTGRETTFRGPGRARACVNAQEESWLPAGDFESSPGAGEAPGAEQWVVTTYGVVRYGAARLVIEARPAAVSVAVSDGVAFAWPAADANLAGPATSETEGWQRVAGARLALALAPKARSEPRDAAAAAATRCSQLAKEAHDLAAALLAPAPDASPSRAADQVRVRRLARAACAVAHLRTAGLPDADAQGILPILRQADADWGSLPLEGDAGPGNE